LSHPNARLTPTGRLILVDLLEQGFTQGEVARRLCLSRATVGKWWRRYRAEGRDGLNDRSSAAQNLRHKLDEAVVTRICDLRKELGQGPHRLADALKLSRSTIYGVLRRSGLSVLRHMEQTTRTVIRYERERPGELLHMDVKKLGRIPDGGGKRFDPGFAENQSGRKRPGKRGFQYAHSAIDDHCRVAYTEILPDEKGPTTAGFLDRAVVFYAELGVTIERLLTDNGGNYRSKVFAAAASTHNIVLKRTRPYRPQTNGKAEAYNKTLQREWAYRRPYTSEAERLAALAPFLHDYNWHRTHTAIGNRPPASRLPDYNPQEINT
jgi:transposase InsO family protein